MDNFLTKTKKPKYLTEELLSTIDMIAQARDSELAFDKTIIAEIVNLNDAETGEYYVKYQQGTFKAYAPISLKAVYSKGTNVYVKIPGGDFSAKKFIEGRASIATVTETEYDFLSSNIIEMADLYSLNDNIYQIRAGAKPNELYYEKVIYETDVTKDEKFINLFTAYPSIKISADFKTHFLNNYHGGNYGLKIEFYADNDKKENNITYTRKLEIANFVGNLYEYLDFSPQSAVYTLKDLPLTNLKKITFFQELYPFISDAITELTANSKKYKENIFQLFGSGIINLHTAYCETTKSIINKYSLNNSIVSNLIELQSNFLNILNEIFSKNIEVNNRVQEEYQIFQEKENQLLIQLSNFDIEPNLEVKNIKLSFVDNIDNTDSLYYVGISAPEGLTLLNDSDKITLEGKFYYALKDIMDSSNCVCYWFKQNPIVIPGHELYNQYAGGGWELITDATLAKFNKLIVRGSDVYQALGIKFVVIYNSKMIFSNKITLVKYYNSRFSIIKKENKDETILELLDSQNKNTKCDWYVHAAEGYKKYASDVKQININEFLNYGEILFEVAINVNEQIVPLEYTLKNYLLNNNVNVIFEGSDTFIYDKDGLIISENLNLELCLKPVISTDTSTVITEITWLGPDGQKIYELARSPEKSMLKTIRVDKNNNLYFTIQNSYQKSKTFNTLQLKVQTSSGEILSFYKTLNFIKEGQKDMSGLTCNLLVYQSDLEGNEQPIKPLVYRFNRWDKIYLHPQVYINGNLVKDQDKINDNTYYNISYQAIGIQLNASFQSADICIVTGNEPPKGEKDNGQYFVHFIATVDVKEKEEIKSTQIIHYYYPVLIGYGNIDLSSFSNIFIPNRILYNNKGLSPSYNNDPISIIYKNISITNQSSPKALNSNITIVSYKNSSTTEYRIYPTEPYSGASLVDAERIKQFPMSAIFIKLNNLLNAYLIQPVVMLLESSKESNIIGQDGTLIYTSDEKVLNPSSGVGKYIPTSVNFSARSQPSYTFSGMAFAEDPNNKEMGLYGYSDYGQLTTSITSNGNVSLGQGAFEILMDKDGNFYFQTNAKEAFKTFIKGLLSEEV